MRERTTGDHVWAREPSELELCWWAFQLWVSEIWVQATPNALEVLGWLPEHSPGQLASPATRDCAHLLIRCSSAAFPGWPAGCHQEAGRPGACTHRMAAHKGAKSQGTAVASFCTTQVQEQVRQE